MIVPDPEFARSVFLRAFNQSQLFLLVGQRSQQPVYSPVGSPYCVDAALLFWLSPYCGLGTANRLLLYTDGILEAINSRDEEFGEERLGALLQATADLTPTETADRIIATVQHWSVSQGDDLTVLVCDYTASRGE